MIKLLISVFFASLPNVSADAIFFDSYKECKSAFLKDCESTDNTTFNAFALDSEFNIDTCTKYAENSKTLLIMTSGIHGVEGFVGSAIQRHFLDSVYPNINHLPFDFLLIHGMNPWGFKNKRRVTENNVDLNRNFAIKDDLFEREKPSYLSLDPFLNPQEEASSGFVSDALFLARSLYEVATHGMKALRQSILEGQYEREKGIFFGGTKHEPHVQVTRDILRTIELEKYETILIYDLHTGYGERGRIHLFPDEPSSDVERQKLLEFFSGYQLDFGSDEDFYEITGEFSTYLASRIKRKAPSVSLYPMVFEVGTLDSQTITGSIESLRRMVKENQGHWHGFRSNSDEKDIKEKFFRMFNPQEDGFRKKIITDITPILTSTIKKSIEKTN